MTAPGTPVADAPAADAPVADAPAADAPAPATPGAGASGTAGPDDNGVDPGGCPRDESVGAALIRAARTHRAAAAALLAPYGLHPGQEFLLTALWQRAPRSPSDLAGACAVEPPTVTRMVGRLESAGLVRRTPDPADRRAVLVELTPDGEALRDRVRESWAELERRSSARLGPEERATLVRLLGAVAEGLASPDGDTAP